MRLSEYGFRRQVARTTDDASVPIHLQSRWGPYLRLVSRATCLRRRLGYASGLGSFTSASVFGDEDLAIGMTVVEEMIGDPGACKAEGIAQVPAQLREADGAVTFFAGEPDVMALIVDLVELRAAAGFGEVDVEVSPGASASTDFSVLASDFSALASARFAFLAAFDLSRSMRSAR